MKTAVVVGSTGVIGTLLIRKLALEGSFSQIIAICRSQPTTDLVFKNPKVRILIFDFDSWNDLELQIKSFSGTSPSVFFCCLGTTMAQAKTKEAFKKVDHDYVVNFSKLAQSCKAESLIVVSALGADKNSKVFYNHVKGLAEEDVQSAFKGRLHFLRPSLLLSNRKEFRLGERVAILLSPILTSFLFGPLKKYHPVAAEKVASVMVSLSLKKGGENLFVENREILAAD